MPHPLCEISYALYDNGVISNDTLCNVSDNTGICDVIANDNTFADRYESDTISYSTAGSGSRVSHKEWVGPIILLQEGSCQDLPESGCGVFDDHLSHFTWFATPVNGCSVHNLYVTNSTTKGTEPLSLGMMQRCASYTSDLNMQDVQDQLEISVEWRHDHFANMCDKEAQFKIDRSQWREGTQGAQYVCLDLPDQARVATNLSTLRLVVLNVGNLPCDGTINPSTDLSMTTELSLFTASVILLLRNLL